MWIGRWRSPAILVLVAVYSTCGLAQRLPAVDPLVPGFPAAAATVEALVPAGWEVEQRHHADFNGDGRDDVLLLLREPTAKATMPRRILVTALATATGYAGLEANARLVPRDPSERLEDPMADGEITLRPGAFELKLGMVPGVGSYVAATMRYRFRLEDGCFRLILYERAETHRGTLDTRDLSVDFLSGIAVEITGNAQVNIRQTRRHRLAANPRRCLADLGSAWTFAPLENSEEAAGR